MNLKGLFQKFEENFQVTINHLKIDIVHSRLYGLSVGLIFMKIFCVLAEYGNPLVINNLIQMYEVRSQVFPLTYSWIQGGLWNLYVYLILSTILECFINHIKIFKGISSRLYESQERKLKLLTNAYLSKKLFKKSLRLYANMSNEKNMTFQGMLKELRQIEGAINSFYTLIRVFFELIVGGLYLSYQMSSTTIFSSLKWGVLVSLLALGAATFAQVYAWRIQYYSDQRLKLTQDIISGIKNIKYLQWEDLFEDKLNQIRKSEFVGITGIQYVDALINFFRRMTSVVLMFATFYSMESLPATQFYTILIFFDKFIQPLNTFPWCLGEFLGSFISVIRIKDYLDQADVGELQDYQEDKISQTVVFPCSPQQSNVIERSINYITGKERSNQTHHEQFQIHINLRVERGSLNMIIGPVGCGKTALLDSLIGEMMGSRSILTGSIAYVSQNPWIFSGTLRDNILFGEPYSHDRYNICLQSSDLFSDLNGFPEGDMKSVGLNGTNLSGGQKQRLALCRALYSNSDVYLFDDILSSVDEHVADVIMQRAVTQQLKGKTIFLVLSQHQYLHYADSIIMIESQQSLQYFKSDPKFKEIIGQNTNIVVNQSIPQIVQPIQLDSNTLPVNHHKQEQEIQRTLQDNYKYYINILGVRTVVFFLLTSLVQQLFKGSFELWTHSYIYSLIGNTKPFLIGDDFHLTFILFFVALGGLTLLRGIAYASATLNSAQNIFKRLASNLLKIPIIVYDNNSSSYFVQRLFSDMDQIDDLPLNHFFSVGLDAIGLIAIISYQQISVLPFSMICTALLIQFYRSHQVLCRQLRDSITHENKTQDIHSFIQETQKGLKTLRVCRKSHIYQERFQDILTYQYAKTLVEDQLNNRSALYYTIIQNGCFLALICSQLLQSQLYDQFDAVNNSLAMTYAFMLFGSHKISSCIQSTDKVVQVSNCLQRLRQLSEVQIESQQDVDPPSLLVESNDDIIRFSNVWLNYSLAKKQQDDQLYALRGITVNIKKGQKVAFCGRTGSGKSSIFNLLVKMYENSKGDILINDHNINHYSPNYIRSRMSVIPQNGFLFSGTLISNLNPKGDKDPKEVIQFLRDHKLLSDRLAMIINEGQIGSFKVESGGQNLSNGEKQIINFVQQVLELKEIVCMDEATSNMDKNTNNAVMNTLFEIIGDRTLLFISHQLENLRSFDKIIVLADGKIVGEGNYNELSETNKYFQELKSQFS